MFELKKEKTKVEISLSIDNAEWEQGVQKIYEKTKDKFNVVGFRKGHAPRKVIEKQYGDSVFFEDTVEYFVNKTLDEVLYKNPDLEPVTMPKTQFDSYTVKDGLKMKIFFDIVPDFELCQYKGVKIEAHHSNVSEKEVDHEIHHILEEHAKYESVDRAAKKGDSLVIDFKGYIDGVAFEGGEAENYPLEIGSHTFIDNFEDQLIGHKKGEEVDVNVTFPEDYAAEEFKGKKALFKVTIKDVKEMTLPEFNDKFVSDTTEFETVDEYRKHISAHIQTMKDNQMDQEIEYNIREYLVKNTNVEIPQEMVDAQVESDLRRMRETLKGYGITLEDYLGQSGVTLEDYVKNAKIRTLNAIKTRYIYRKLIAENNIEVSAKELEEATKGMTDPHDVTRRENELLLEKLHKFLKENNNIEVIEE